MVIGDMTFVHPKAHLAFSNLAAQLQDDHERGLTATLFMPFETYRTPYRQALLIAEGDNTRAGPWRSAHQYGLAIDFVPYPWSWAEHHDWGWLDRRAREWGLRRPIPWDRAHIEHPIAADLLRLLR